MEHLPSGRLPIRLWNDCCVPIEKKVLLRTDERSSRMRVRFGEKDRVSEVAMARWDDIDVVLVDRDPVRRAALVRLARALGVEHVQASGDWASTLLEEPAVRPTVVLVDAALLRQRPFDVSRAVQLGRFFVALVSGGTGTTPEFLAAGCGAVLYEPITAIDLERVFALARSVLAEGVGRERRLQIRLSALRQVESDLTLLAELTPEWLTRSLELLQPILGVPALAVWRVDWETNSLLNDGAVGLPAFFIQEIEARSRGRASALVRRILESVLEPVDMRETSTDERLLTSPEVRRSLDLEAGVVVPVRRAGQIVALLSVYLAQLADFDRADLQLYDAAAEALAVAWKIADTRREILQNQILYRTLVEEEPVGVLLCSLDGTVRLANGAAARLLGYERPERLRGLRLPESVRTLAPLPWDEWVQRPIGAPQSRGSSHCCRSTSGSGSSNSMPGSSSCRVTVSSGNRRSSWSWTTSRSSGAG